MLVSPIEWFDLHDLCNKFYLKHPVFLPSLVVNHYLTKIYNILENEFSKFFESVLTVGVWTPLSGTFSTCSQSLSELLAVPVGDSLSLMNAW